MAEDWEVNYPPPRSGLGLGTVITVSFLVSVIGAGSVQLAMQLLKPDRAAQTVGVASQAASAPVKVPDMRGLSVAAARQQASDLGLRLFLAGPAPEEHIEESRVLGQAPLPGSLVRTGDVIEAHLASTGSVSAVPAGSALEEAAAEARKLVSVPNVVGATIAKASQQLTSLGLTVGTVQQVEATDDNAPGTIVAQGTAPGTEIGQGIPIALTVAAVPAPTVVPKVGSGDASHARRVLKAAGLRARIREVFHPNISSGYVIRLKPKEGTQVEPGSYVDVYIAE